LSLRQAPSSLLPAASTVERNGAFPDTRGIKKGDIPGYLLA
jgi:hypothetical protein